MLTVNSTFSSKSEAKAALISYSVENFVGFKITQSSKSRLTAKCKSVACSFLFVAVGMEGCQFSLKKLRQHSCHLDFIEETADPNVKGIYVEAKSREVWVYDPSLKPATIIGKVHNENSLTINYTAAYRAIKRVKTENFMNQADSYGKIAPFLDRLCSLMPGSVGVAEFPDNRIKRVFLCPITCIRASQFCLPIIALDACHVKNEYKEKILAFKKNKKTFVNLHSMVPR